MGAMESDPVIVRALERLRSQVRPDGGSPYYPGGRSSVEPTLLAALALSPTGAETDPVRPLLAWARKQQNPDGSLSLGFGQSRQGLWVTALAAAAFTRFGLAAEAKRALDFVLSSRSVTAAKDPMIGQDDTLPAWPWISGTSGWVEPTAWSLIALGLAGLASHPRAQEGIRFLLDRQIPAGGWNYGNPSLSGKDLLPFWDTTGLALVALRGRTDAKDLAKRLGLLEQDQPRIESLSGLAWTVLGLESHGRNAGQARSRLLAVVDSLRDEEFHVGNFALGLIALSESKVFIP